jgi:hypothetical protein
MNRMKLQSFSAIATLSIMATLAGCSEEAAPPRGAEACARQGEENAAKSRVFVFREEGALASRVEQKTREDGRETLLGETTLVTARVDCAVTLVEYVEIDPNGALVYADVSALDAQGHATRRMLLDPAHGAMFVQDEQGAAWAKIPTDAPWLYTGLSEDEAAFSLPMSPVAAWAALRAARGGGKARLVDGKTRRSVTTMSDQVVVENHGRERMVVLGSGWATGDASSVTSIERGANGRRVDSCGES